MSVPHAASKRMQRRTPLQTFAAAVVAWAVVGAVPEAASTNLPAQERVTQYGAPVKAALNQQTAFAQRIGRPDSVEELVTRLLLAVTDLSGYRAEDERPPVSRVALGELHRRLCGGPCTVRAAYVPGEGLFIDETLRPDLNPYHQSILFHELVHHVQEVNAVHAALDGCNRWRLREIEAYQLQNRFLLAVGAHARVVDPGMHCAADSAADAHTFREDDR